MFHTSLSTRVLPVAVTLERALLATSSRHGAGTAVLVQMYGTEGYDLVRDT